MKPEEILEAAKEAGLQAYITRDCHPTAIRRFAAIIEKRTIERCAVAAYNFWYDQEDPTEESAVAAIRKLGEQ